MKSYTKINNLLGWMTFLIASTVYILTVEPTASFWDCPEFITTAHNLEIGHPPGAPFFMLMGNFFSQFASGPEHVAYMINIMSALMSGACILFLFWTTTHLMKKLIAPDTKLMTRSQLITIMSGGLVGAFAYAFSDTFWYSAVEAEVYASSSLFTAVVFWLILKWESVADDAHSDRWLILIAYLTGLSIGVHLLNLLCIPAIVLVYFYKKNPEAKTSKAIGALIGAMVLIAVVLYGIVPGVVKVGGWFELLFVNQLGMNFNTGLIFYIVLLIAILAWGIYESFQDRNKKYVHLSFLLVIGLLGIPFYGHGTASILIGIVVLVALGVYCFASFIPDRFRLSTRSINTSLLAVMMILVGYSSYTLIVIRSSANPPMDQNSPEDIFSLGDYLSREQYGERPLLYGRSYNSSLKRKVVDNKYIMADIDTIAPVYRPKKKASANEPDRYEVVDHKTKVYYQPNMLFPRMYSSMHKSLYESWMEIKGKSVNYFDDVRQETATVTMPTQWENLKFFVTYQLNFMYWRYFLWNFAGRQNDIQGNGELEHGNWITGFNFIDNALVGNQEHLPTELKENKGHNVYYCLPLILGLLGIYWQVKQGKKGAQSFWTVFFLFFMTGIAIVLYLNQTPMQPRERDYAYAASFYAFTIWIGMGVAGVRHLLSKGMKDRYAAPIAGIIGLMIPLQMISQTWNDHDRSDRYTCRDFGLNYLQTLPEGNHPIIYTNGDNDTFPLWYNQDVEQNRTDARVCNLSYLQTDWYIDQMVRPSWKSPGLPITWQPIEYAQGTNEYVPINTEAKEAILKIYKERPELARKEFGERPFELKNVLDFWIRKKGFIPSDELTITLDKEAIRRSGMKIPAALNDSIPDEMKISLKGKSGLKKSELMMLEMLANANWERPIYMATTVGTECHLNLDDYFLLEGLAYRITPFNFKALKTSAIDTDKMYNNMMHKFKFGNISKPGIYLDETVMRMCQTHRRMFAMLIKELVKEGKKEQALKALRYCEKMIPVENVPYSDWFGAKDLVEGWYKVDQPEQAEKILCAVMDNCVEYIEWYLSMNNYQLSLSQESALYQMSLFDAARKIMADHKSEKAEMYNNKLDQLYGAFITRTQSERHQN